MKIGGFELPQYFEFKRSYCNPKESYRSCSVVYVVRSSFPFRALAGESSCSPYYAFAEVAGLVVAVAIISVISSFNHCLSECARFVVSNPRDILSVD
jgi:hypothetical protein